MVVPIMRWATPVNHVRSIFSGLQRDSHSRGWRLSVTSSALRRDNREYREPSIWRSVLWEVGFTTRLVGKKAYGRVMASFPAVDFRKKATAKNRHPRSIARKAGRNCVQPNSDSRSGSAGRQTAGP